MVSDEGREGRYTNDLEGDDGFVALKEQTKKSPVDRKHARDNRPDMGGAWSSAREVILAGPGWDGSQSSVLCFQC